ncbi:MAG: biotin transporter BioY [Propionibacteriaceae bacterium]
MDSRKAMTDVALIGVFAALIAAFALTVFNVPGNPVPITLQTLGIALAGLVLGPWRGFAATMLYVLVGLAGLPVFAGGGSGLTILTKGSAGYLLSFPLAALVIGLLGRIALRRGMRDTKLILAFFAATVIASLVVIHPLGIVGLMRNVHISLGKAMTLDMAFWLGDIIKCSLAAVIAATVHKAFPALSARNN